MQTFLNRHLPRTQIARELLALRLCLALWWVCVAGVLGLGAAVAWVYL